MNSLRCCNSTHFKPAHRHHGAQPGHGTQNHNDTGWTHLYSSKRAAGPLSSAHTKIFPKKCLKVFQGSIKTSKPGVERFISHHHVKSLQRRCADRIRLQSYNHAAWKPDCHYKISSCVFSPVLHTLPAQQVFCLQSVCPDDAASDQPLEPHKDTGQEGWRQRNVILNSPLQESVVN